MVWFRVDDNLSDHPKVLTAGNAAMGLWVRAGAWSMKHLTDGFVPDAVASLLGSVKETQSLVSSGLWLTVEGGFQFHAWEGRQPTREAVKRDRDAAAERQQRARDKARESRRDGGVSNGPPVPSRPDPTQTDDGDTPELVTEVDAREEDRSGKEFATEEAAKLGIKNLQRVRTAIKAVLGEWISWAETVDVARALIELSTDPVKWAEAYIERVCTNSPDEVHAAWSRVPRPGKQVA